jgi:protein ImuB
LSLHFPQWPIDLARRRSRRREGWRGAPRERGDRAGTRACDRAGDALILVETVSGAQRVVHRCAASAAAGVQRGMALAEARALVAGGTVRVEEHDPIACDRALRALAAWASRFSPIVAVDPPDGLLLDVEGCQRLFHGERRLVNLAANSIEWLGVRVRAAAAATWGCALAAARFGAEERAIVPPGGERAALSPLPVEALRIDEGTAAALREVGIDRVGHLLEIPRLELAVRFEPSLLRRLDQATGDALEAIEPLHPRSTPGVERVFDGPVCRLEAIALTVRELIEELARILERRGGGATSIVLTCDRADTAPAREIIMLSRPSRCARHLWSLLRPRVEAIDMGFGIERIALVAGRTARLPHEQGGHWGADHPDDGVPLDRLLDRRAGELVDVMSARLGPRGVLRAETVESHVPERAFAWRTIPGEDGAAKNGAVTPAERPSRLFAVPEPAEVIALTPDGPPSWLRWRGAESVITASAGPERIALEWWLGSAKGIRQASDHQHTRDYYRIQDEPGRWLWIFHELETGRWFVHGTWA